MLNVIAAGAAWYNVAMSERWITTTEAAELSGYSVQYLRRLIRNGKVKARKFGPTWQVSERALVTYVKDSEKSDDKRRGPTGIS